MNYVTAVDGKAVVLSDEHMTLYRRDSLGTSADKAKRTDIHNSLKRSRDFLVIRLNRGDNSIPFVIRTEHSGFWFFKQIVIGCCTFRGKQAYEVLRWANEREI